MAGASCSRAAAERRAGRDALADTPSRPYGIPYRRGDRMRDPRRPTAWLLLQTSPSNPDAKTWGLQVRERRILCRVFLFCRAARRWAGAFPGDGLGEGLVAVDFLPVAKLGANARRIG